MAMIECPECKGTISNKATQCVHCGCKINNCFECGNIFAGEQGQCPECGFSLNLKQTEQEKDTLSNILEKWDERNPWLNIFSSVSLYFGLLFLGLSLFVVAIILVIVWKNGDPFKALAEYKEVLKNTKTLCIFASVLLILRKGLDKLTFEVEATNFYSWCKDKNIDIKACIKQSLDINSKEESDGEQIKEFMTIDYIANMLVGLQDFQYRIRKYILFAFSTISIILFSVFMCKNIEIYMQHCIIVNEEFSFSLIFSLIAEWWMLITATITYIVGILFNNIFEREDKKLVEKWIEENFPENLEIYKQKIKEANEKIDEIADDAASGNII